MIYHETKVAENEIVIGRVTGFGTGTTYAIHRQTGDERLVVSTFIPMYHHKYVSIDYVRSCKCIMTMYRADGNDSYYVSRDSDGTVYLSAGYFRRAERVPLAQVQDKFDEAQTILDDVRSHYAHLIPVR